MIIVVSTLSVEAQILNSRYSQYTSNGLMLNPAYAGSYNGTSFTGFYLNQWEGIDGAPITIALTGHTRLNKWERVGVGGYLENDQLGLTNLINAFGVFSYSIPTENGTFSAGFQGGVQFFSSDLTGDGAITGDNGLIDPALINENQFLPNFGAGLYYYTDNWYIGSAVPYLVEEGDFYTGKTDVRQVRQSLQIITTAGYVLSINDNLDFKPSMLLRVTPKSIDKVQTEITGSMLIKQTFWVGLSTRFNTATLASTAVMLGADFPTGLRIGYAYDYSFNNSNVGVGVFPSSHEVMVGYDISKSSKGRQGPRYF